MSTVSASPLTPPYALAAPSEEPTTQLLTIEAEDAAIMSNAAVTDAQAAYEDELNLAIADVVARSRAVVTHGKAVIKFLARLELAISKDLFNPKLLPTLSCVDAMVDTLTDAIAEYGVALHTSKEFIMYDDGSDEAADTPNIVAVVA